MTTPPPADGPSAEQPRTDPAGWALPDGHPAPEPPAAEPAAPGADAPPQPPPPVPGPSAAPARTNRLAIVTLVTGVLGLIVLAIGFGVAALVQIRRRGERGLGLAVTGLAVSAVWIVAGVAVAGVALGSLFTVDRDGEGNVVKDGKVLPELLRVGDCFTGFEDDALAPLVTALPCTRPHDGEVVARLKLKGDGYPGDNRVHTQAHEACDRKTVRLGKSRYADDLELYTVPPTRGTWRTGDREVTCFMRYTGVEPLAASLNATVDARLRYWHELKTGDCIKKWDARSRTQRVIDCTEPHWLQVYATFEQEAAPYPGGKAVDRASSAGCEKRMDRVFRGHREPDLFSWVHPGRDDWKSGLRTVICMTESEDGPLRKSVLPR